MTWWETMKRTVPSVHVIPMFSEEALISPVFLSLLTVLDSPKGFPCTAAPVPKFERAAATVLLQLPPIAVVKS